MIKETDEIEGVEYVFRTLDITGIPGFENEVYKEVTVSEHSLGEVLEDALEKGSKGALKMDESIFFYLDDDFIKSDPTDEEIIEYLKDGLGVRYNPQTPPKGYNLYSIVPNGRGGKTVHVIAFTEYGDHWLMFYVSGFEEPIEKFVKHLKENPEYVDEEMSEYKQYVSDYMTEEEVLNEINTYFNGKPADYILPVTEVTVDTPCGNYMEIWCDRDKNNH